LDVWLNEDNGTIAFNLEEKTTSYQIVLRDTFTDNLQFEVVERKVNRAVETLPFQLTQN
jgi:hypothetical protein